MAKEAKRKVNLERSLAGLELNSFAGYFPLWTITEKVFSQRTQDGVVMEERGWVLNSMDNIMIQLEKDAKRVTVIHRGRSVSTGGITRVVISQGPDGNHLNFTGRSSRLSLLFTRSGLEVSGEANSRSKAATSFSWKG